MPILAALVLHARLTTFLELTGHTRTRAQVPRSPGWGLGVRAQGSSGGVLEFTGRERGERLAYTREKTLAVECFSDALVTEQSMFEIENGERPSLSSNHQDICAQFLCNRVRYLISYRRILQLTTKSVRTINPDDFSVTNDFQFDEIARIVPNESDSTSFAIELRVNKGKEKVVQHFYTSEYRPEVLCRLHECLWRAKVLKARCAEENGNEEDGSFIGRNNDISYEQASGLEERYYSAKRLRKQGSYNSTTLVIKTYGLVELDARSGRTVQTYYYFNISHVSCNQDA